MHYPDPRDVPQIPCSFPNDITSGERRSTSCQNAQRNNVLTFAPAMTDGHDDTSGHYKSSNQMRHAPQIDVLETLFVRTTS